MVEIFSQLLSINLNYGVWPLTFQKMCKLTCHYKL